MPTPRLVTPSLRRIAGLLITATFCSTIACSDTEPTLPDENPGGQVDEDAGAQPEPVDGAVSIDVTQLDFDALAKTTFKETSVVALTTIWAAAGPDASTANYTFSFRGDDGFVPTDSSRCAGIVVDAAIFAKGYLSPETRTLAWDDDLGYPGCMAVKGLASIVATPLP